MTQKLFKVISSTPTDNGSGFITKLQHKTVVTVDTEFGKKTQQRQETYYIKLDNQVAVGLEKPLSLEKFDIVERLFTTDEGDELTLKWLFLK